MANAPMTGSSEEEPQTGPGETIVLPPIMSNESLYWILYFGMYAVYAILSLLAIGPLWKIIIGGIGGLQFNLGFPLLAIVIVHFVISLEKVEKNEVAGKYSYGVPLFRSNAGLNFVPKGIMQLTRYPADIRRIIEPGTREQIFWGDEELPLPEGKVRPLWVPTKSPSVEMEGIPMHAQMVVGLTFHVFYRIVDVFSFHAYVGVPEDADEQTRLVSVRVLHEDIVQYTAGEAVESQKRLNNHFDDNIRKDTSHWGIQVTSAGIDQINLSHALGTAMRNRAKAQFEAQTKNIQTDAQAYETVTLGNAEAEVLMAKEAAPLKGRAIGVAAMAEVLKANPNASEVLAAETARETMERANVIFAGGAENSLKDLMAGTRAVQEAMKTSGGGTNAKST